MTETNETETEEQPTTNKNEPVPIYWDDINNLEDEEQYEVDQEGDALSRNEPPVPGTADFLITVDPEKGVTKREMKSRRTKENVTYYMVNFAFVAKSDNIDVDGSMIYVNVSTLYNEKKKTSTLMTVLSKMGVKVSDVTSGAAQLRRMREFVDQEPIKPIKFDWELSYKQSDGKYQTMYTTFKDFPSDSSTKTKKKVIFNIKLKDGSYAEIRPRLKVISFSPGTENNNVSKNGTSASSVKGNIVKTNKISDEIADLEKSL